MKGKTVWGTTPNLYKIHEEKLRKPETEQHAGLSPILVVSTSCRCDTAGTILVQNLCVIIKDNFDESFI